MAPLVMSRPITSSNPTKPTLKRVTSALSGNKRLRDETDLDPPSSPSSKRQKRVEFNPEIKEQAFEPYTQDLKSVRLEVRRAIEEHLTCNGDDTSELYDAVKEIFTTSADHPDARTGKEIGTYLQALAGSVSSLDRRCNGLVMAVLHTQWLGREERFVKQYVNFLGHLVSAQGIYVPIVLEVCVNKFSSMHLSSLRLEDYPTLTKSELTARLHMALKYLLRVIPSASSTLSPILTTHFPYADASIRIHRAYIDNLIKVSEYAPELKAEIYALITERLVKIDVQMQEDLEDFNDNIAQAIVTGISLTAATAEDGQEEDSDLDSDSDSDEDDVDDDEEEVDPQEKRIQKVKENVEKMDLILDMLFTLYSPSFEDPGSDAAWAQFKNLIAHFVNIILPAYRSRHTQFLLFHFAQRSPALIDRFTGQCVKLAFDQSLPVVFRESAAAYLASFLSRGAHVSPDVVQRVFDVIGKEVDKIRRENEKNCRGPDLHRYSTFYATTQALLYIFCFRWRDLIMSDFDDEEDPKSQDVVWALGVKELLWRTIYSPLNPLKVCAPIIVEEFAKITRHLGFIYVYPLLENNKRLRLSQFVRTGSGSTSQANYSRDAGYSAKGEGWYQLDAYFPFDPYHLPISKKWIQPDYLVWKGIPGLQDEEEESEDEESDDEEDEEAELSEEEETLRMSRGEKWLRGSRCG